MIGIAVVASELPVHVLSEVTDRLHDRAGCLEVRFDWHHNPALLPVKWEGAFRLLRWGSRERRSPLPFGPSLTISQIEAGIVADLDDAVIPASLGLHHGTWFLIEEGIRAVVVPDARGGPVAYMLTEPSTNYYRNMSGQSKLMPVLVNQTI